MPYYYKTPSHTSRMIAAGGFVGCLMIGTMMSLIGALMWSNGDLSAETIGYAIGCLLIPGIFSLFIAASSRRAKPLTVSISFLFGCTLVLVTNYAISH